MLLGREARKHGLLDEIAMEKRAKRTLRDLQATTVHDIRQHAGSLSGGQRQALAVAKAVMLDQFRSRRANKMPPAAAITITAASTDTAPASHSPWASGSLPSTR